MISVDYSKKIKVKKETGEVQEEEEREQAGELNSSSSLDQLLSFSSCPSSPAPSNKFVNTKESQPGSRGKRKSPAKKVKYSLVAHCIMRRIRSI